MEQGSNEWLQQRAGKFTGSRFADLMAVTRSGPSASRQNLITLLSIERLTGEPEATYQNDAMRRGAELEPFARGAYEAHTGELLSQVAFVVHETMPYVGVSPDGFVGDDGLVEIKCPASLAKHVAALRDGSHADEYRWQIQGQLWVTGRAWCDAVSFDPRFPEGLQLAIHRVERDEAAIAQLKEACIKAHAEVNLLVEELRHMQIAA